jgi:hypothetical protein
MESVNNGQVVTDGDVEDILNGLAVDGWADRSWDDGNPYNDGEATLGAYVIYADHADTISGVPYGAYAGTWNAYGQRVWFHYVDDERMTARDHADTYFGAVTVDAGPNNW